MSKRYDELMAKARAYDAQLDAVDRARGGGTPRDQPRRAHLATAAEAIRAGLITADWSCVAEGLVMLEEVLERLTTQPRLPGDA